MNIGFVGTKSVDVNAGGVVPRRCNSSNALQLENADEPMLVILSGRLIDVRLLQPENADEPILETPVGIVIEMMSAQ